MSEVVIVYNEDFYDFTHNGDLIYDLGLFIAALLVNGTKFSIVKE